MQKHIGNTAAVIDIGSGGVRMLVSQWNGRAIEQLDYLEKPLLLGQEVFSTGYITFETVRALSAVLDGFNAVAAEYDVGKVHATATTALREAVNQAYILDYLSIQNRLKVQVLDNAETGALMFHYLRRKIPGNPGTALLVYGGTGTIDFALYRDDATISTTSIHTGLLKVADLLGEASEQSLGIDVVAREFLQTHVTRHLQFLQTENLDTIFFGIRDVKTLMDLMGVVSSEDYFTLARKQIVAAYDGCSGLSLDQLAGRMHTGTKNAGAAYAALTLLYVLLKATSIKKVHCASCSLSDASMEMVLRPGARRAYNEELRSGAVASALVLSRRYHCDEDHAHYVCDTAMIFFESLRKLHGLSRKHSLLLRIACILHEAGRHTNAVDPQEATYNLIRDTQVIGLDADDTLMIANIVAPQSLLGVERSAARNRALPAGDILIVAKMHALLHLADALDFSRKQKAQLLQIRMDKGNSLTLHIQVQEDFTLEKLLFRQSASLFQEVFGMLPVLEIQHEHRVKGMK